LQKSPIKETVFLKETCNFIDPTDRGHPVPAFGYGVATISRLIKIIGLFCGYIPVSFVDIYGFVANVSDFS